MRRALLAALVPALAACRGGTSTEPPILYPPKIIELVLPIVSMNFQPRYHAQGENAFWPDRRDARLPPEGTVARGHLQMKNAYFTGLDAAGQPVAAYPVPVDMKLVQRGQERFNVYCAPCHDRTGSGHGLTPRRGWIPPPSFHSEQILGYAPGQFFQVISHGIRTMPSYAAQVPVADRWAIISYVQALQRSGHATISEIPEGVRGNAKVSSNSLLPPFEAAHAPVPDRASLRWDPTSNRKVAFGLLALGVLGLLATLLGIGFVDAEAGWSNYLQAFTLFLQIALGTLFFVMLHHLTGSRWGVTVRRVAEASAATLPVFLLLFLPLAIGAGHVWEWADPGFLASHPGVNAKAGYLNLPFFYVRAAIYFAIWIALAQFFWRQSLRQDAGQDVMGPLKAVSAPGMLLFGLSLSFAAFDWLMSLDPHWYSTIFGVYYFAGAAQGMFATLILVTLYMQRSGLLRNAVTVEHYHDLGKFAFGFTVFFAYIAFSQYMLIWYANIPEETEWYLHRWGPWAGLSITLIFVTFVFPLLMLMSRQAKRVMSILAAGAGMILIGRAVDMYWLVMPAFDHEAHGPQLSWMWLTSIAGIGGIYLGTLALLLGRHALIPLGDPLLKSSLGHENV